MENIEGRKYDEYKERLTNFSNEFDLGLFVHIVRKSIVWVFLLIFLSAAGAYIYLKYTPGVYEAKVIIQLGEDDNATKVLNVGQYNEENSLQSKLELLRSKLLIKETLKRIPIEVSYFAEGEILTNEHYTQSPYEVEILELKSESARNKAILVNFEDATKFELIYRGKEFPGQQVNQAIDIGDVRIRVKVNNPESLIQHLEREDQLFFRINSLDGLSNRFYGNLDVRILNNTAKTMVISYRDHNPHIARDFVMAHAEEFINFDLEKRSRSEENIINFIDAQIDTVFEKLRNSESTLNTYKQENKITNLSSISEVYLQRLTKYEDDVLQLELELKLLEQVELLTEKNVKEIQAHNIVPLISGSTFENTLTGLLDNLNQLLIEKEEALYSVTIDNDRIKSLEHQIGIQKNLILESVSALRDKVVEQKKNLSEKVHDVEGTYYTLPEKELEFARLQRLLHINEKYYTMLLEKRIEYRISKEGFVSRHQVLEEAPLPRNPISPRKNMILVSFVLTGAILGFILISIRYLVHNNITSLNEIVRLSHASISTLGVVPKFKREIPISMLIVDKNPKSIIAEAFRSLRTNLQFISNEPGPKTVAVTSTISGEGKTFIALNLAGIIAYSGKKVVVLDLDMRKPKIHKSFKVDNSKGMSSLLIGKDELEDTIQNTSLEHLDFITAGPIPPNPSELILGIRMKTLIDRLKAMYDVVIIDTPPVGLVTDGVELIKQVDYPLYVFRSDYSKKQFVQVADRLINENKINKLAVILNGVDLDRNRYSYKYSYGYGYGYGYGYSPGYGGGYYSDDKSPSNKARNFFKRK